jgi:hypothetical protein
VARRLFIVALIVTAVARVCAQPAGISDSEAGQPPAPARLAAIHAAAQRDGWAPHVAELRAAALRAYESDKPLPAEAWYHVYRWAALFGQKESDFVPAWIHAVETAKVVHANMPTRFETTERPLGARVSPELQLWLLGNAAFSIEFFSTLTRVDFVPRVFEILNDLHRRDAVRFKAYASLALAIAVVFDVPPPPTWPHAQVSGATLPRKFPAPADAFGWWIRQEQLGRTHHKLSRLGAEELKFVVDAAASFADLEWAQKAVDLPFNQLARAYGMVRYRVDRVTTNTPVWPGRTYALSEILATGGICPDQAYFATQVGKARGVPTLLFYGSGSDARHAWFGFLDGNRNWQLDAGRYAEQRFVTGYARDPQTWMEFSDHDLQFLRERFHALPSFRQSRVHADFAQEYLALSKPQAAAVAARKAVNFERRNQAGWEALIAAARAEGRNAKTVESVMREAALAFQRYPDLEALYVNRVAESLRARGETSAAAAEVRHIAIKNKDGRGDLSIQQARDIVQRAVAEKPLLEQIRSYNSVVDTYGHDGGIEFFDQVVVGFAEHLVQLKQKMEALRAIDRARHTLRVEPNSQLEHELARLAKAVQDAK